MAEEDNDEMDVEATPAPAPAPTSPAAPDGLCVNPMTVGVPLDSHGMLAAEVLVAGREKALAEQGQVHERGPPQSPSADSAMRPHGAMSPTTESRKIGTPGIIDLVWFKEKVEYENKLEAELRQNYLDYYKKYTLEVDGGPSEPQNDLGEVHHSWALIFQLPDMSKGRWAKMNDGEGEDSMQLLHPECWNIVQRLWACDLTIHIEPSSDGKEVHISVGASYEVLVDEANEMRPRMRMINCKGSSQFESEMISNYMPDLFVEPDKATCFTSGMEQQLVMHRMQRIASINLEERLRSVTRERSVELINDDLAKKRPIRARRVRELLSAHGGFRPAISKLIGEEIATLRDQVVADPFFKIDPEHKMTKAELAAKHAEAEHMKKRGLSLPTYDDITNAVQILTEYVRKQAILTMHFRGHL